MTKVRLTDRFVESRKKAGAGRQDYFDSVVPGLALRVTDTGHKSFVLIARYPARPKNPTRRALGDYGEVTLTEAREKARGWLDLIGKGIDPKIEEARQKALELRRQVNSFAAVAEQFLDRHAKGPAHVELERRAVEHRKAIPALTAEQACAIVWADPKNSDLVAKSKREGIAKKKDAEAVIRSEFIKRWGARPASDILPEEVAAAIRAIVERGASYQAHNALGYLRRMFNWAIGTREFGLVSSPIEHLRPADLIGKRQARDRVLSDDELRAAWKGAEVFGYPYGPLVQLLILTGQREREVSDMAWSEINLEKKLWTIPAERMKGDRAHIVPLSSAAVSLIENLPRFVAGPFVFSTTAGRKPVNGFSKAKARLDAATMKVLRDWYIERNDSGGLSAVEVLDRLRSEADDGDRRAAREFHAKWWVFHDLRRTVRTHFSALPVQDIVRELVIAHAKPGLHRVYDQHAYLDEKRQCLELWALRLHSIVNPKPADITDIRQHVDRRRAS